MLKKLLIATTLTAFASLTPALAQTPTTMPDNGASSTPATSPTPKKMVKKHTTTKVKAKKAKGHMTKKKTPASSKDDSDMGSAPQ